MQETQQVLKDSGVSSSVSGSAPAGVLRKCVINGKTVFSDVECSEHGQVVKVHETRGYEAPRVPARPFFIVDTLGINGCDRT